jgi:CubicO group peptidase (beta-lactamase class C family)
VTDPLTAEGLARFSEIATELVDSGQVPGVVAMAARGGQVHTEVLGSLSVGGTPMREDSIFRLGSMSKPLTGAATMALVAEGLLRLDEPVDRLLPELADRRVLRRIDGPLDDTVPAERAITVRDLLTFTYGFGATGEMQIWPERFPVVAALEEALHLEAFAKPDLACPLDPDTWIARLGSLPLMAQPGERFLYNTGAAVLGVLLERAAGRPLPEVMRTRLFEPLGMRDTGFSTTRPDRMATACRWSRKTGYTVLDERGRDWSTSPAFCDAAVGLISTAGDLLEFSRMLLRGGSPVLPAEAVAEMTRDQLTPEQKARVGMGKNILNRRSWGFCMFVLTEGPDAGGYSQGGAFGTSWLVNPELDLTVIVLTQRELDGPSLPKAHFDLIEAARSAALGPVLNAT